MEQNTAQSLVYSHRNRAGGKYPGIKSSRKCYEVCIPWLASLDRRLQFNAKFLPVTQRRRLKRLIAPPLVANVRQVALPRGNIQPIV